LPHQKRVPNEPLTSPLPKVTIEPSRLDEDPESVIEAKLHCCNPTFIVEKRNPEFLPSFVLQGHEAII
jgi:hypothetical protein